MATAITYQRDLPKKMLTGMDQLADTIKVTLGPKGRNVMIHQKAALRGAEYSDRAQGDTPVLVINDGATIAKAIVLADDVENMGAQLLKEVTEKANTAAGDGTTTAVVLAQAMVHDSFRNIAAGAHPLALRRGMATAAERAIQELKSMAKPVSSRAEISAVASVSCQDDALGALIGQALDTVGLEGVIQVEESKRGETTLEVLEGIVFDRGFLSPRMTTDEAQTVAELHHPLILFSDKKFTDPQDLIPALILAAENDRPCLIISDGVEGEAMGLILKNKVEGDMDIVCVLAPLYGEGRSWRMEDMAVQTGGVYLTQASGLDIRKVTLDMLGSADYVKVTKGRTVVMGGGGDPQAIQNKVNELRYMAAHTDYEFNQKRYQERLAKFVSGVATLQVGGRTQAEMQERKFRVEDAVNAARAAYEEGIVPGGGVALLDAIPAVRAYADSLTGDERTGAQILLRALEAPARQILRNAGLNSDAMLGALSGQGPGMGYDVESGQILDMLKVGIADPVKVTRLALGSAVSLASTLLTSEAGVVSAKTE